MSKVIWTFENPNIFHELAGPLNETIKTLMLEFDNKIYDKIVNGSVVITTETDENIDILTDFLNIYSELYQSGIKLEVREMSYIINILKNRNSKISVSEIIKFYQHQEVVLNTYDGRKIFCKTFMQYYLVKSLIKNQVIFAIGSAGTGKTYLAMAFAVAQLKKNLIKKIIITRPAVEAGEKLGFLPGDLKEKVDPYLVPIYDALNDFLGKEQTGKLIERGIVEIAPLAYMRGRTLDNAIIILDEAQNTTKTQMRMFLTRLGFNSKMIITGDATQIDLPKYSVSGLVEAKMILQEIDGISFVEFTKNDVMRNPIVTKIIEKYEMSEVE